MKIFKRIYCWFNNKFYNESKRYIAGEPISRGLVYIKDGKLYNC